MFSDCAEATPSRAARNKQSAKRLWEMSEEWTKAKESNAQATVDQESS